MKLSNEFITAALKRGTSLSEGDADALAHNPQLLRTAMLIDHELRALPPTIKIAAALLIGVHAGASEAEHSTLTDVLDGIERASQ